MIDAYYSQNALRVHFDGAHDSTAATDVSVSARTLTFAGSAALTTAESKFGGAALSLPGSSYVSVTPDISFASGDLTMEAWVKQESASGGGVLYALRSGSWGYILSMSKSAGSWTPTWQQFDSNQVYEASACTPTGGLSGWVHVAFCRVGNVVTAYVNGTSVGGLTTTRRPYSGAAGGGIGRDAGGSAAFVGFIDEVRITLGTARYTADFTPPTEAFPDVGSGSVLVAPMATLTSFSIALANAALTPPSPTFYAGDILHVDAALTSPSPTLGANGGAYASWSAPAPTLYSTGHDSTGDWAADLTAPSPTLSITTGAHSGLAAPSQTLTAAGTVTIWGGAPLTAPSPTLSATTTVSGMADADLSITTPYDLIGYGGAVCSVTLADSPTLLASGTTGGIGGAALSCPLFELTSSGTAQNHGSADLLAPSPTLGQTAQAWLVAPGATLTAIGSAVVTATYEAYAINLQHTPRRGVEPVDEATRYTNFPFTHVVRYKNSYYGANSTGLYLLEGTTDNGTPIPWAFETAITDFKSPNKKTLASAYFSGRFGTSSTIQLKKGEKSPITHAFTTPRGTLAQNHRQVFGKDRAETRTRYFALAASGTSEFELDAIECDVHNTTRRI